MVVTGLAATYAEPAWVMVSVWPPMVRVPERVAPGFASKLKTTFVLPVPLWLAGLRCNHVVFVVAVHVPDSGVIATTTLSVPADGASRSEVVPIVAPCMITVRVTLFVVPPLVTV